MSNQTKVYLGVTDALIESVLICLKSEDYNIYNYIQQETNRLIKTIKDTKYDLSYPFKELPENILYINETDLLRALSVLRQIKALLRNITGDNEEDVEKLKLQFNHLKSELNKYEGRERIYLEMITKSARVVAYPIDENKLKLFSANDLKLMKEALDSYGVGAYTACICVCRTLLESLVQQLCKANSIAEGTLKRQLEVLVEKKVITENNHSILLEVSKFYGQRAAHPTTEVIDRDKANLVLSSLFIVNEELFNEIKT